MNTKLTVFKELDSLRALAVAMTLAGHWLSRVGLVENSFLWYGVDIFFTISGFLITRMLLQINATENKFSALKNFYIRRALRLFPAYYLLIVAFFLALNFFNLYIWDNKWNAYYFSYLANWYWYLHPNEGSGCFNHIWSLGLEEQFYLVWPWFIAFLPIKRIKAFIVGCILFALLLHFSLYNLPKNGMVPFFRLHTLGVGALLGYFHFQEPMSRFYKTVVANATLLLVSSFALFCILLIAPFSGNVAVLLTQISLCIVTGTLVIKSVYGWGRYSGLFFRNRHVQYIGVISYGIYLYHMPVPDTLKAVAGKLGYQINYKAFPFLYLFIFTSLTLSVSVVSYKFIETPFLRLKARFVLKPKRKKRKGRFLRW